MLFRSVGMYPLLTNDRKLTPAEVLQAHKGQPRIEKRFEQVKTVHQIAPVYLKDPARIEALFTLYFLNPPKLSRPKVISNASASCICGVLRAACAVLTNSVDEDRSVQRSTSGFLAATWRLFFRVEEPEATA